MRRARIAFLLAVLLLSAAVIEPVRAKDDDDDDDDDENGGGGGGGGGGGEDEDEGDEGEYSEELPLTFADVSDCQRVLDALSIPYTGATVFCPSNVGMKVLAWALGFRRFDEMLEALSGAGSVKETVTQVMRFHVHPGNKLARASIPGGRTVIGTLTPSFINVVRDEDDSGSEVTLYANEDEKIRGYDLTFEGMYTEGDPFVVHAIWLPLLPEGVDLLLSDDGPGCKIKVPEKVINSADVADCKHVIELLEITYTNCTVWCPMNDAMKVLAWAVGYSNVNNMVAAITDNPSDQKWNAVKKLLRFHVTKGVWPLSAIPEETSTQQTLVTGQSLTVEKTVEGRRTVLKIFDSQEDMGVPVPDLTFDGKYNGSSSDYVVHAIAGIGLKPTGVDLEFDDDGPPEGLEEPPAPIVYGDVADCGRVLDALGINYAGATLFCPRNFGMQVLAWSLAVGSVDDLLTLMDANATAKGLVENVMKFNAHPGGVLTKDLIPEESSTLTTMLPSKTLRLEKSEEEGQVRVVVFANEDEAIQGFDLTFTGAYDSGSSGYVVHAIGLPLLPSGSPLVLDDDGPCRPYNEEDEMPAHKLITDCRRLFAAVNLTDDLPGNTVLCPTNGAMSDLAEFFLFKTVGRLFAELALPNSPVTATIAQVMRFHIHPGVVTGDQIPGGESTFTTLIQGETIKVVKEYEDDDNQNGTYKVVLFANDDAAVRAFDLSFSGAYNSSGDSFVVHSISGFLLPSTLAGPPTLPPDAEGFYTPPSYAKNSRITAASLADCRAVLTAAGVDVKYSTVMCPTNQAMLLLARSLGFTSVSALLANLQQANSPVKPLIHKILAYQVYPESSMTETELPYDQGNKAVEIPTLASEEGDPDAKRKVRTTGSGKARTYRVAGADAKGKTVEDQVQAFDMSSSGRYSARRDSFVIHAVPRAQLPPNTFLKTNDFFAAVGRNYSTSAGFFRNVLRATVPSKPMTLFLPDNAAWSALGAQSPATAWAATLSVRAVQRDATLRDKLARYHMVDQTITINPETGALVGPSPATTLFGSSKLALNSPSNGIITGAISASNQARAVKQYMVGAYTVITISDFPLVP